MIYYFIFAFVFEYIVTKTSSSLLESIILYGTSVRIEDFPYFASTEVCGASILSERWLLTAAHCVDNTKSIANQLVFVGGALKADSIRLRYNKIIIHPDYKQASPRSALACDVAVLRLQVPLKFSEKVQPVKLPSDVARNASLTFIGRGLHASLRQSNTLKRMDVALLSAEECLRATLSPHLYQNFFSNGTIICGRKVDNKPGLCFGDSGGPMVQDGTIVGIASFLVGNDCRKTSVGFYTNVVTFVPWIKSVTDLK